jgi:large subunit ribosomal protein L18
VSKKSSRNLQRLHRHTRVRKHTVGLAERPRLVVFRSLKNIYAQVIDDVLGHTLVAASSLDVSFKGEKLTFKDRAKKVGELVGAKAIEKGIQKVVFDRGGYKYHGRVAALAEGARSSGLDF